MDDIYLVEIRLARTHWKIKGTIESLAGYFRVRDSMEEHPHVTLFGPFALHDKIPAEQILDRIGQCAAPYDTLPFMIGDWEKRDGLHGGVIAFSVVTSDALRTITRAIASALNPLSDSLNHWDENPENKWFHVTVANRLEPSKANEIINTIKVPAAQTSAINDSTAGLFTRISGTLRRFLHTVPVPAIRPLLLDETGLRITVMWGEEIFAEYDLLQKRWVRGKEIHETGSWKTTIADYRHHAGFELSSPVHRKPGEIYLIADLHLGHANIIRYCSRPFLFSFAEEMDRVLIQNWNNTVSPADTVFFLGDLRYGRDALPASRYREQLNGTITFIRGNHDTGDVETIASTTIEYDNRTFLLVHDPKDAPPTFDGWVIHGHHHNNDLRQYPFMDFRKKQINVSVEVLGYSPVSIQELSRIIGEHETSGEITPILLRYPYTR